MTRADPPPKISIVVPSRPHESVALAIESLTRQTHQDFELILIVDSGLRGAPWARNRGAELARGDYVLFSDCDLDWAPDALECMLRALESARKLPPDPLGFRVGYAYPAYLERGVPKRWRRLRSSTRGPIGDVDWDFERLRRGNFVHTSSLIAREHLIEFDPALPRLQDWDLWLRLAIERRVKGVATRRVLFETRHRPGITHGGAISYADARTLVQRKHGLEPGPRT